MKTEPKYVKVAIDDIENLNARHFVGLGKEKAVEELTTTFGPGTEFKKDKNWAAKAFDTMATAVKEADTPKEEKKAEVIPGK